MDELLLNVFTDNQPSFDLSHHNFDIPNNVSLADSSFASPGRIDMLLGASLFFELLCVGQIQLGKGLPILQKTRLGWIVSGDLHQRKMSTALVAFLKPKRIADSQLEALVKNFWEIEALPEGNESATPENTKCENLFKQTLSRLTTGEFSVRLPFKLEPKYLGNSYQLALRRFLNLEKKLERKPDLKAQYAAFMQEYEELNHMSEVPKMDFFKCKYFLPHHCVLKNESTTTKLRVVFDASALTSSGYSLNDLLIAGPSIQPKLFDTLIRFRMHAIALTADICKMYRCVRMTTPDDYLQCILWRSSPHDDIKIYKLNTVTYGTKSAAFLAIRSMQQLAVDERENFPIGSRTVLTDFYVDDMMSGGNTVAQVIRIMIETKKLLSKGNFLLRKWCTNSQEVINQIPEAERETLVKFEDGSNITKALGLVWNPNEDVFIFSFNITSSAEKYTKRIILSIIARFYDPLGLIGPVITKAKIFLQRLWRHKLDWDESLPQSLQTQWCEIYHQLHEVQSLTFPRYVLIPDATVGIHAFCDASLDAYGACIYTVAYSSNKREINLLCSKSRVSPLQVLTIPKLELCAALLLAQLINEIVKIGISHSVIHCWSDSMIVLSWIKQEPSKFNVFVANRVAQIASLTKGMHWHHIASELNPADILSKGASPKEISSSSLWMKGPPFLKTQNNHFPENLTLEHHLPELRKRALPATTIIDCTLGFKYINSFGTMQRIFGYVYKFIKSIRSNGLTVSEIQNGAYLLIKMTQVANFRDERKCLLANKQISPHSSILSLSPFLDENELLRVGGRLRHSSLDYNSRHPIILPKGHVLTESIITHFHRKHHHAGPQALLAMLRLTYWPVGGKTLVNRVLAKCVFCFKARPRLFKQLMGDLPANRVQESRPFMVTGVDYCGPLFYQPEVRNRKPTKCYISIFVCFATKAAHLELVRDLSTASFIAALKRFVSTRGRPKTIWSDNATNFVGAKNELAELKALLFGDQHQQRVHHYCLSDDIEWRFIPPRAPHFGGLWEAAVKTAKHHLYRAVVNSLLNFEELRTLICQVCAIMNSRPLCPLSEHPDDLNVLTPGHFLIGASFAAVYEHDISALNVGRLNRWQRMQQLQQLFWNRWSTEYLTILQQRAKWRTTSPNLSIGSLVLIKDENLPPLKWPLARVIELIYGHDRVARVAMLKTSSGIIKRAAAKLCPLPSNNEVEN